ncbi:MAG TPA: Spy/CpxP family protein refolding chaperone [Telluria sp.]|nr:Spy/CpxP family protein refolding chaperone [Telluria sp.]
MKTLSKTLLIGMTAFGIGTASLAWADETPAPRHEQMAAKRAEHFAQRQAKLHDALKLSAQQEAAWSTFQAAIQPRTPSAHPDRAAFKSMSAPERMQKMIDLSKQRTERMEAHLAAVTTFYGQLNDEQKKTFDGFTSHHGGMRHHFMHRG